MRLKIFLTKMTLYKIYPVAMRVKMNSKERWNSATSKGKMIESRVSQGQNPLPLMAVECIRRLLITYQSQDYDLLKWDPLILSLLHWIMLSHRQVTLTMSKIYALKKKKSWRKISNLIHNHLIWWTMFMNDSLNMSSPKTFLRISFANQSTHTSQWKNFISAFKTATSMWAKMRYFRFSKTSKPTRLATWL
jgi:hypothetical protein